MAEPLNPSLACVCVLNHGHTEEQTTKHARTARVQTARPGLAEGRLAHAELKAHGACGVGEGAGIGTDE